MDEGYEIFATLTLPMSDEELGDIVEELSEQEPDTFYPEAWRVLIGDLERRQAAPRSPRIPISVSRLPVFEDLPSDIQTRLKSFVSHVTSYLRATKEPPSPHASTGAAYSPDPRPALRPGGRGPSKIARQAERRHGCSVLPLARPPAHGGDSRGA